MAERRDLNEFINECDGFASGYELRPGQTMPETYEELVNFIGDRLHIPDEDISIGGLSRWLINAESDPNSCSPEIDTKHLETIVLIGALSNPDEYVATLPETPWNSVILPPPENIRMLLNE